MKIEISSDRLYSIQAGIVNASIVQPILFKKPRIIEFTTKGIERTVLRNPNSIQSFELYLTPDDFEVKINKHLLTHYELDMLYSILGLSLFFHLHKYVGTFGTNKEFLGTIITWNQTGEDFIRNFTKTQSTNQLYLF